MRHAWMFALLVCMTGCASRMEPYVRDEIPRSYLQALAREEGISEEDARQMVLDARGKLGNVSKADIAAGRVPGRQNGETQSVASKPGTYR